MINSPFACAAKPTFVKIQTTTGKSKELGGYAMFLERGDITSNENPQDSQEAESESANLQWTLLQAIERVAEQEKISKTAARSLIFDAEVPEKDADPAKDGSVQITKEKASLEDYLTQDEFLSLAKLRGSRRNLLRDATSAMMRYRMAYTVEFVAAPPAVQSSDFTVEILPAFFSAPGDSRFLIEGGLYVLAKPLKVGDRSISFRTPISPPARKLASKDLAYLIDPRTGLEKVGVEDWTDEMTRDVPYGVQAALRDFFEQEAAGMSQSEMAEALANAEKEAEAAANPGDKKELEAAQEKMLGK